MRMRRSASATSSSTPSSTLPRPSCHWSTTRIENCSISSGRVVGTISTATWLPFACANARNLASSADTWSGVSVPVRSVTGDSSGGTCTSAWPSAGMEAAASQSQAQSRTPCARREPPWMRDAAKVGPTPCIAARRE